MPTFEPPTYATNAGQPGHPGHKLFRRYTWQAGYSVLITDGVASTYPGVINPTQDAIDAADSVFLGGHTHTVTAAEKTILESAGYTVGA